MSTISATPTNNLEQVKKILYLKSNIGGWFFDAIIRVDHVSTLKITEHPVQQGAAITDHAYMQPRELTIQVKMSDAAKSVIPGQFSVAGYRRSHAAFEILQELQKQRIPVQVVTRLGVYQNMLVEVISAPNDFKTNYALDATITMREIIVAKVTTVKMSSRPQKTGKTNRGNPEPVKPNQSVLKQIADKLTGKK